MLLLRIVWAALLAALWMLIAQAILLGSGHAGRQAGLKSELGLGLAAGSVIMAVGLIAARVRRPTAFGDLVWAACLTIQSLPGLVLTLNLLANRGFVVSHLAPATSPEDQQIGWIVLGLAFALLILLRLFRRQPAAPATTPARTAAEPTRETATAS
jgi:hypothetical protein